MERKEMELHLAIDMYLNPAKTPHSPVRSVLLGCNRKKKSRTGFTDGLLWFVIYLQPQNYMKSILNSNIEKDFLPHFEHFYNSLQERVKIAELQWKQTQIYCQKNNAYTFFVFLGFLLSLYSQIKKTTAKECFF
jgi:hypothetical protein